MGKFLLLIVGVFLLFLAFRSFSKSSNKKRDIPRAGVGENMVRCAHCGVHLPTSESIAFKGEYFCGEEHRRLHQQ